MKIVQLTTDNREHYRKYSSGVPSFGAAPEALFEGFSQLPDVDLHVVCCLRNPVQSPAKIAPNISYHPIFVPKAGWMSTFYQGCIRMTRRKIKEIAPDIVHGQGTERDCAISAVHSGVTNVITIHGNMAELHRLGYQTHKLYGMLTSVFEGYALRHTTGVFCNSAYTESLVRPRTAKTWRVPNAIRSGFFEPSTAVPDDNVPHLLNVGVVNPRKRQLEILRCMRRLNRAGHKLKIIFAGGLSEDTEYGRSFVKELRIAEKEGVADYAGFLGEPQLVELMDLSSGFVHFPTEEAFGLVVAEAMSRGLKFFGAKLGGICDIAERASGAELHDDFASLERGIANWIAQGAPRSPDAAIEMRNRYHPKVIAEAHLEIYREILSR